VEHEGGFLLCGMKDGSAVQVLDDASYEAVATVPLTPDYGDRVTRMQVINDVLFVSDAGSDSNPYNAVLAAPLSPEGQDFFDRLVANLSGEGEETESDGNTAETPTEAPAETEAPTEAPANTNAPAETDGETPTEAPVTEAPGTDAPEKGCGSSVAFAAVAILTAAAAFVARKKD
jgi:hypothetical protein